MTALTVVTWNLHRARGADGRVDADRIHRAIEAEILPLAPDLLALQEADAEVTDDALLDLPRLAALGLRSVQPEPRHRTHPGAHGFRGVLLLAGPRLTVADAEAVELPGHWPRGAVVADVLLDGAPLRAATVHLSRLQPLRIAQMRTLGQALSRRPPRPLLLAGDLNEWRPWLGGAFAARLTGTPLHGPARATFPAARPVLPVDRILASRPGAVRDLRALGGPLVLAASDHRPLAAVVHLG